MPINVTTWCHPKWKGFWNKNISSMIIHLRKSERRRDISVAGGGFCVVIQNTGFGIVF